LDFTVQGPIHIGEIMKPVKISIENFQSIEKVDLEIQGLCVLVGKTNIGKSAIIRAISSALMNDPVVGMIRSGATSVKVDISSDDYQIQWERGEKGVNRTRVDGKLYDKTGSNQLDVVSDLGFGSVEIGGQDVYPWYASQFSPIFLLDRPGGQVTEFISEISRLNVLQDAISISVKQKTRENSKANDCKDRAAEEEKIVGKYSCIDGLQGLIADMALQKSSIESTETKIQDMESHFTKLSAISDSVRRLKAFQNLNIPDDVLVDDVESVNSAEVHQDKVNERSTSVSVLSAGFPDLPADILEFADLESMLKHQKVDTLGSLVFNLPEFSIPECDVNSDLNELKNMQVSFSQLEKRQTVLEVDITIPEEIDIIAQIETISAIRSNLEKEAASCKSGKQQMSELDQSIIEVSDEIKTIPTCPTCEQVTCRD